MELKPILPRCGICQAIGAKIMNIEHVNGTTTDTNTLNDVDAELMEASKNIHALFAKYGRQMLIIGEMKSSDVTTAEQGCAFFHVGIKDPTPDEFNKAMHKYLWRLDGFINMISRGEMFLARKPVAEPPKEQS
jgi:hypothetical protein